MKSFFKVNHHKTLTSSSLLIFSPLKTLTTKESERVREKNQVWMRAKKALDPVSLHCDWLNCAGGHTFVLQKSPFHDAFFIKCRCLYSFAMCCVYVQGYIFIKSECNAVPHQKSFLLKSLLSSSSSSSSREGDKYAKC